MLMRVRRFLPVLGLAAMALTAALSVAGAQEDSKELTPNARFMSGNLYFQQKVYDKAEEQYRLAVLGDSTNAQYRARWALALCEVGKERLAAATSVPDPARRVQALRDLHAIYSQAQAQFAKAIELDPGKQTEESGNNRAHYWVEVYKQAITLQKNAQLEDALEYFDLLTKLDPNEPEGLFQVGYTFDKLNQPKKGVDKASAARALAVKRIADLGDCGQFKSARLKKDCQTRIKNYQTVISNVDRFTKSRFVAIAEEAFDAAEALPKDKLDEKRASLLESESYYRQGLEADPKLVNARFNLGNVYFGLARSYEGAKTDTASANGYYRKAAATFDFIAGADSLGRQMKVDALYNSASASFSAGDWKKSIAAYKAYIDMDCRERDAFLQIALCFQELKQLADRAPYFMTYNAMGPQAEKVNLAELQTTITNRYPGSDAEAALTELGPPDDVKRFQAKSDAPEVTSFFWTGKGIVRHYIDGKQQAEVKFAPCVPAK